MHQSGHLYTSNTVVTGARAFSLLFATGVLLGLSGCSSGGGGSGPILDSLANHLSISSQPVTATAGSTVTLSFDTLCDNAYTIDFDPLSGSGVASGIIGLPKLVTGPDGEPVLSGHFACGDQLPDRPDGYRGGSTEFPLQITDYATPGSYRFDFVATAWGPFGPYGRGDVAVESDIVTATINVVAAPPGAFDISTPPGVVAVADTFSFDIAVDRNGGFAGDIQFVGSVIRADGGVSLFAQVVVTPNGPNLASTQVSEYAASERVDGDRVLIRALGGGTSRVRLVPIVPPSSEGPPPAPQDFTATGEPGRISLAWTDVPAVIGYTLDRQAPGEGFTPLAELAGGTTTYTDATTVPGTLYTYRLSAFNSLYRSVPVTAQAQALTAPTFTLSVVTTDGGSITSSVGGINCQANNAGTCAATFLSGATVTLNALPATGYQFTGWTGDADCSDGVVTMDGSHSCVATFVVAATTWRALGGALNRDPDRSAIAPELAVSLGNIYAAWTEAGTGEVPSGGVFVSRWSGSGWVAVGGGLEVNANTSAAYGAQIVNGAANAPLVAWIEGGDVYMKRWDGANWNALGGNAIVGVSGTNFANQIDLAVDSLGNPVMAIEQGQSGSFNRDIYVRRFENGAWTTLGFIFGDAFTRISASSLVIDGSDAPVVAFEQLIGFDGVTVVSRYDVTATFGNFRSVGGDRASETGFDTVSPSLAIDASGNFVVVYIRTGGTVRDTIVTRRFDGTVWTNLTASVANVSA
ncbi:MAG TPA: hypothetical protein VIM41_00280, partial [Gammaproteobacteria bacterium]